MAMLYVTHDLAVVAQLCSHVQVMYSGRIVESGSVETVFRRPMHPYTLGLIQATPDMDHEGELRGIPGSAPGVFDRPAGCPFHPRCRVASEDCAQNPISLRRLNPVQETACLHPERCEDPVPVRG